MNEQLIKFIELCLMDGVVTDKEREVIFRKSKELGVDEDECEIILEGMIQQKGGEVSVVEKSESIDNTYLTQEEKIEFNPIENDSKTEENIEKVYLNIKENKLDSIKNELVNVQKENSDLNKQLTKLEEELEDIIKRKSDLKENSEQKKFGDVNNPEGQILEKLRYKNEQEFKKTKNQLTKNLDKIENLTISQKNVIELYDENNLKLFKSFVINSPILFQTKIFEKYLEVIDVENDKQILNLTRFNKFLISRENNYNKKLKEVFEKFLIGDFSQKRIDDFFKRKEILISLYNSFHLMYYSLINKKMGVYMNIYTELESIGIFNSFFEKEVLKNLNSINNQLKSLNNTLSIVSKQISQTNNYLNLMNNHLYKLRLSFKETNMNLNQLNSKISDISSSVDRGNDLLEETNSNLTMVEVELLNISNSIEQGNRVLEGSNDFLNGVGRGMGFNTLLSGIQSHQSHKLY